MPFEMVADKIHRISPEYHGELLDFLDFLIFRQNETKTEKLDRKSHFGELKDRISYIAPDFDEPLEDFAEYM